MWEFAIKQVETTLDKRVAKKASVNSKNRHFHEHEGDNQKRDKHTGCNDSSELNARLILGEGWRW
jgi:hypothetical protein